MIDRVYEWAVTDVYLNGIARIPRDFDIRNGADSMPQDCSERSLENFGCNHPSTSTYDSSTIMQDLHGSKPFLIRAQQLCSAQSSPSKALINSSRLRRQPRPMRVQGPKRRRATAGRSRGK
jgi:hypothetical protein